MPDQFVIFPGIAPDRWSLAKVSGDVCQHLFVDAMTGLNGPFAPLREMLTQLGYADEGILLALPSSLCLCAAVEDHGLRKGSRSSGLLFRLEEQLPMAMEEIEADFIAGTGRVLGVAVAIETIAPLIDALEAEHIPVVSICPTALLAAGEITRQIESIANLDALLLALDGKIDLVGIENGQVLDWTLLAPSAEMIELHLRQRFAEDTHRLRIKTIGCDPELRAHLAALTQFELVDGLSESTREPAARAAAQVLAGKVKPPVELRRGKLASGDPLRFVKGPLRAAAFAAIVFLLVLAAAMFWQARRYESLANAAELRQLDAFRHVLPKQVPPPLIASRMLSEQKRLEGLSGATGALPPSQSILPVLQNVLRGLPADLRFRLLELRFEPNRFYLDGQSLDHSSADRIADALRHSTGLQVDPPHTEQPTGQDVTFEISAAAGTNNDSNGVMR